MTLTQTINELALKYAGGDKSSAKDLYKFSKHVVTGYLYNTQSDVLSTDAEDVFEDAFWAGLQSLKKKGYKKGGSFKALLITIANRKYIDLLRANSRHIKLCIEDIKDGTKIDKVDIIRLKPKHSAENPANTEIVRDMANEVLSAMQNIDNDDQRNVLVGRLMFQKQEKELADAFDRNESTIKSDLRRGLMSLAHELDKKGIERESYAGFGWLIARKMYHTESDIEMIDDRELRNIMRWINEGKSRLEITEMLGISARETGKIIQKAITKFGKLHIRRMSASPAKMTESAQSEWLWKMSGNAINGRSICAKTRKSVSAPARCVELANLAWFTSAVAGIFDGGWKRTLGEIVTDKLRDLNGKELTELCRKYKIEPIVFAAILSDTLNKADIPEKLKAKIRKLAGLSKKEIESCLK